MPPGPSFHGARTCRAPQRHLVILGSGVTALAVVRSAHRLGWRPVLFDTRRETAAASRLAQVEIAPGRRRTEAVERLCAIARRAPSVLIATSDAWLRVLAASRPRLEAAFERILHPPNAVLQVCLAKDRFAEWCEAEGLPAPARYRVPDGRLGDGAGIRYPVLLRPAATRHNDQPPFGKAVEARSPAELGRLLEAFRRCGMEPVVSQSLLGRRVTQYSVGAARDGTRLMSFVARKLRPWPRACSTGTLVETVEAPRVEWLARQALERLPCEGIAEVEVLEDEDSGECHLIEINPRPWQQFALAPASGHDLLGFLLTGRVTAQPRRACWLDFQGDLQTCFGREHGLVRGGELGVVAWLHSLLRVNTFARWSWRDPGPFWRDGWAFVRDYLRGRPRQRALTSSRRAGRRPQTIPARG